MMKEYMIRLSDYIAGESNRGIFNLVKYFLYGVFAYLSIDSEVMGILAILMSVDTICGVIKSLRLGKKFSTSILVWGFVTKFLILIIPMVVALMGKPLHKDFTWAVEVSIRVLIINEGLSVLANIISVYSVKDVQNVDLISRLIAWIRSLFTSIAEKFIQNIKVNSDRSDEEPNI